MWSLIKKKEDEEFLQEYSGEALPPLKFSNNKTQADIVSEILGAINSGEKIIFIRGKCGTGKSAVALNLARHFSKTAIVVPIKSLQEQYEEDYTKKKFILKEDNKKLKISVIKGRNNFLCPFSGNECKADNLELPCTIEIREKNFEKLMSYIERNPFVNKDDFLTIYDIRRFSIAPACPFWSPVLPSRVSSYALSTAIKRDYKAISGEYSLFQRKKGCKYYDQYESYIDSDVLIFNSQKYLIETLIGRKPKTDLDVIDECDEFLDNFCQEKRINLNRLAFALSNLYNKEKRAIIQGLMFQVNELILNYSQEDIEKLENTQVLDLIEKILSNPHLAEDEEENYFNRVFEICLEFQNFLDETYVLFRKEKRQEKDKQETCYIDLVTINLAKRFEELAKTTKTLVLMSGTLHSEEVLRDIFNIKSFKIIEAETIMPGTILKLRTGKEKNCKYENLKSTISREEYLKMLSACIEQAKTPVLVHITAFSDLPTEEEKQKYKIENLISRERLRDMQEKDKNNSQISKFKNKEISVLFTTKCSRGIDFPGEQCNSIILTRYPYPDINSIFWKILKKEQPGKFSEFYLDKAKRELLQKIYRGVRFKTDHVLLLSPDSRVLNDDLNTR